MVVSPNDPRINQTGFAKLLGDGIEVYAKKYEIVIGRHSKSSNADVVLGMPRSSLNSTINCSDLLQTFDERVWSLSLSSCIAKALFGSVRSFEQWWSSLMQVIT